MPVAKPNETSAMAPDPGVKRSRGEDAAPAQGHVQRPLPADYRQVKGWGVDLDPKNRPMVPREVPSNVETVRGEVRDWQTPREKIHVSNEHPDITPVFGTSAPPRGLSGLLRDYAFEYGEGTNRHWMTLLLADRIDVIEHMIGDAFRGEPDHYAEERGSAAFARHGDGRRLYGWLGAAAMAAVGVGVLMRVAARGR